MAPVLLGMVFKTTGAVPLVSQPLKRDYAAHDFERTARRYGIPFRLPSPFPYRSLLPASAFYAIEDRDRAVAFAQAIFDKAFVHGTPATTEDHLLEGAASAGIDGPLLLERIASGEPEKRCVAATEEAMARGVFGSRLILVDSEPFWGQDRLADVDEWLTRGGW